MKMRSIISATALGLVLAIAPVAGAAIGFIDAAVAKGGNGHGGGNGGGNGRGNSGGNSGNHSSGTQDSGSQGEGKSGHQKSSDTSRAEDANDTASTSSTQTTSTESPVKAHHVGTHPRKSAASQRAAAKPQNVAASLGSLNSLKRNYHAYLNSKDPKMAALSAYVKAYAEFEMQYGPTAVPTDPALSDNALRSALAQLASKPVTEQTLAEAKSILGVGTNAGKIAEVRDALEQQSQTSSRAPE